ncbi:MAG: hypothetical protein ACP5H5_00235 [Pyrobaculum sp.]|jgi:hypothetical protein
MIEDVVQIAGVSALAAAALLLFYTAMSHVSTPGVCHAARLALENPGSQLVVYGKFATWSDGRYVYLSCGLAVERDRVLAIEKNAGVATVGSTLEGKLYIR